MHKIKIIFGLLALLVLQACSEETSVPTSEELVEVRNYEWKLVTSWPKNFPGLGHAPELFAKYVNEMSGGQLKIKVYGAGELVPGFEVFDAVSQGTAQMGHSGAYYWKGKMPAAPIFSAIPFGMNAAEMNAWLAHGGGLELWRELYAPFGVVPYAGGNTGAQMAGWFKREITSLDDFSGLKMRIPGLGGEVFKKVGGVPVSLTGGEIFVALQTGAIDASEWVGPYNDLAFGLFRAAKYYYTTPWHEPGSNLEFLVNKEALEALPAHLQKIIEVATKAVNQEILSEYAARNVQAMRKLTNEHGVKVRQLPEDVLQALKAATMDVIVEKSAQDATFKKVYKSYEDFYKKIEKYNALSEQAYFNLRQ
ncbi:TRAP transporter substrate-binding protein [Alteromonas sp. ASW11-130]|uniref:TRAP transporter substrate-binding protein n=1 Tax=Alteromonas sp. ASW11-130 TaxID=3015775 RepID=UPI002241F20D|nr:TRAP transporter substrate-binding protein [Alteromonas sp. ASW11-130]MCW8092636.1 TRAP transporter substrate-binding protein [Alteromonas sp. ASW11-130]